MEKPHSEDAATVGMVVIKWDKARMISPVLFSHFRRICAGSSWDRSRRCCLSTQLLWLKFIVSRSNRIDNTAWLESLPPCVPVCVENLLHKNYLEILLTTITYLLIPATTFFLLIQSLRVRLNWQYTRPKPTCTVKLQPDNPFGKCEIHISC